MDISLHLQLTLIRYGHAMYDRESREFGHALAQCNQPRVTVTDPRDPPRGIVVTMPGPQAWGRSFVSPLDTYKRVGLVAI